MKTWHQLVTRHQETVVGITVDGRRVQVTFRRKGMWKNRPNNPRRQDGVMHEYCPPEVVQDEMDRFFALHAEIEGEGYPVYVEAGWMHHRFMHTHPFQDGNGRVSRMLMAYAFIRRGEPPPVIPTEGPTVLHRRLGSGRHGRPEGVHRLFGGCSNRQLASGRATGAAAPWPAI